MKISIAICCFALTACVGASEIVPAGKDTYIVSGHANGGPVSGQGIIAATKAANEYCTKAGKFMVIRNTQTAGSAGLGGEHSELIFSCVTADDPDYKRPNLRKDNGVTTIENR